MPLIKHIIISLIFITFASGQNKERFVHFSTENGLSQSDVNSIYQDKQGFMWFGTHDGLNRFDGYKFKVYKPIINNLKSISSNLIWTITGDKNGNLWVATTGGGINFFDKKTENFIRFKNDVNNNKSLANNEVANLMIDSSNRLWIGTENGIDMLDLNKSLKTAEFCHYKLNKNEIIINSNHITTIFEDKLNQIWVGSDHGLFKLSRDKKGEYFFTNVTEMLRLPEGTVSDIAQDEFGRLYFATSKGLYTLNTSNKTVELNKISETVFDIIVTSNNYLWAGGPNGLSSFTNKFKDKLPVFSKKYNYDPRNPAGSINKDYVKSLCVDNTGVLWIGMNGGGINKIDIEKRVFKHINKGFDQESISNDNIRSLYEDSNGSLWVGTDGGGLNMSLKNNINYSSFKKFNAIPVSYITREIQVGNKKKLLIGAGSNPGLFEVDITNPNSISNASFKGIPEVTKNVFGILEDSHKNLWIGTYNGGIHRWLATTVPGVYKKDILTKNNAVPNSLSNDIIRNIMEDKNGNIWFGTANGLCKLSPKEKTKLHPRFEVFKNIINDPKSLSQNYILKVFESRNGTIWIGTIGGGLNKLIPSNNGKPATFESYTENDGLPNNVVKSILEDAKGNLWLSTNYGLSKFNPTTLTFKNYDINDGLQSNEFTELTGLQRKNGEFLFGGVNGITAFFPNQIIDNTIKPITVFTNFFIFNKQIKIGEEINGRILLENPINEIKELKLKYKENSFSIEFAALHYSAPQKNKYAYKLEDFNSHWMYTTSENRYATYTNLSPGTYTLLVKSTNSDGVWNDTPAELKIIVTPPFWRSNFAYFLYLIILAVSLITFRRYTVIRANKKHQLELESFENVKNEEMHRLKLEFFTNISHEFRTPLTLIKGPLEYLQKNGAKISADKIKDQYNVMDKNVNFLLRLVNQLLDFRKMDKGKMDLVLGNSNIFEFIKLVGEPFQFLSRKKNITFEIASKLDNPQIWFDSDALEKILNNLLSNAFKFTTDGGKISIVVAEGDKFQNTAGFNIKENKSDYIYIKVKDSGLGISPLRIKNIFERFYIDRDYRKVNNEGTGIGLDFTKKLVELHQGSIDVTNNKKQGASFIIWLPIDKITYENVPGISFGDSNQNDVFISETNAETHAVEVLDEMEDQNITRSRSKLPILLIVEDNADIRALIRNGLEEKYYIYEAENGQEGLEMAHKFLPNIIITDIFMPIMDGIEMCDKLKHSSETSHIPIIILTAKTSQEWEKEGLKNGADGYVRKPFDMELLELKIKNILKYRGDLRKKFNREFNLQPNEVTVTSSDELFLQKAIDVVEKHMMNTEFSVELMVKEMALSRSNLYLKIKELTGLSSSEFIRNIRLKRATQLLEQSDLSVKEIMYMTGFNTASYFSKCFKKQFGVIPSRFLREIDVDDDNDDSNINPTEKKEN